MFSSRRSKTSGSDTNKPPAQKPGNRKTPEIIVKSRNDETGTTEVTVRGHEDRGTTTILAIPREFVKIY